VGGRATGGAAAAVARCLSQTVRAARRLAPEERPTPRPRDAATFCAINTASPSATSTVSFSTHCGGKGASCGAPFWSAEFQTSLLVLEVVTAVTAVQMG